MQFINNIYHGAKDYYDEIPKNTLSQMMFAFGATFIIISLIRNDPRAGAISGALSVVATAVHGLVTPLFKYLTKGRTQLTWGEEMCRTFTAIIAAGSVSAAFGNRSIHQNLMILGMIHGVLLHFLPHDRRDLTQTSPILVSPDFG